MGIALYRRCGKRILDLSLAVLGLVLLLPVIAFVGLLVRFRLGNPVLFGQERLGLHGQRFRIYKFRTMTDNRDAAGALLPDADRLTPFGRLLRETSLDELPELWNVIKGDMSLVGPRPLLLRYYPYFTDEERLRFSVPPGITGLAQVSGRNQLGWDQRIAADVEYVCRLSFSLDGKIIFKTVQRVVSRQGLQVDPASTMLDFDEERRRRAAVPEDSQALPDNVS